MRIAASGKAVQVSSFTRRGIAGAAIAGAGLHWGRNVFNEKADPTTVAKTWEKLPPHQSIYHTQGAGNEGNAKYVSPRGGHKEAVLDAKGNHVVDDTNKATFNFFGPNTLGGIPHAVTDVVPYFLLGNSPRDMVSPKRLVTTAHVIREKRAEMQASKARKTRKNRDG